MISVTVVAGQRNRSEFYRFLSMIDDIRGKMSFCHVLHHQMQGVVEVGQFQVRQFSGPGIGIDRRQMTKLCSDHRADSGQFLIECLLYRGAGFFHQGVERFFCYRKRVLFFCGVRDKIGPSWQNLPDRADLGRHMLDAV